MMLILHWDPNASFQVNQETFYVKHPVSLIRQLSDRKVQRTILRGETVLATSYTSQLTGRFILNT